MKITISYGYTFNKGNYESERIDASIEVSSKPTIDGVISDMDKLHDKLKEWVWNKGGKI